MNLLKAFYDDLYPAVPFLGRWVLSYSADIAATARLLFASIVGERSMGEGTKVSLLTVLRQFLHLLFYYPAQLLLTILSLVLNAVASLINHALRQYTERSLNQEEVQYLKAIFADNLNYANIRIQFGGVKELLKISPQAVGNDIFLRQQWGTRIYFDDLTLTNKGLRLLGHEACHVWQSQHTGSGYIGDSLITQVGDMVGRRLGVHLSHGYDVEPVLRNKQDYKNFNVEQQAVIAELIGVSCALSDAAELNKVQFCEANGIALNDDEYAGVEQAHHYLRKTVVNPPLGL